MEDYDSTCDIQIEGVPTFRVVKQLGIYEELPREIPDDIRSLASRIYEDNINKTTRGNNRLYIKFTCVCIAVTELHYEIYDPFRIADLFSIKHDSVGKAFKSNIDLYNSYRKLTKITPIGILKSRILEFGIEDTGDFFIFIKKFMENHGRKEFILNSSPIGIAAGLFTYYCEICGLLSHIEMYTISNVFNVSEQIINQKKEEIKRMDN